jgi:NAD(P)-dependent dehydrogenase (short-subunit alcohol dehydrogenase family)
MSERKKTILVTGATSGIGRAAALHLAARGHRVFASGRNPAALVELEAAAKAAGVTDGSAARTRGAGTLETLQLDVTDAQSIARAKDAIHERTRGAGLDVLVNNAGFGVVGPTELISEADMRAQYETNVFGLMAVTRAFLPEMRARRSGRIVNVSSLGGRHTLPLYGVYNSTKYAVESLSDALRIELGPFGVDVVLIEPGAIATEFTPRSLDSGAAYRRPDSPYAPVLERYQMLQQIADRTSAGPATTSRAIERAATARRPRARYVAPRSAGLLIHFLRALPTRWADQLARLALGFTRRRFAARAALPQLPALMILAALLASASATALAQSKEGDWKPVKTSDGIVVDKRTVEGSKLMEFRGRAQIDAPAASILAVFSDVPHATEWMDSCNGSHAVADLSDHEKVVYNRTHAPWPVSDRDAVLHNVVRFDDQAHRVELQFWTVEDNKEPPVKGVVRMPFLRGHWILSPSADGRTTNVEYQIHANPGGQLPNWLVNYVSRDLPLKTIQGLRAQLKRRSYPDFDRELHVRYSQYPFLWPSSKDAL